MLREIPIVFAAFVGITLVACGGDDTPPSALPPSATHTSSTSSPAQSTESYIKPFLLACDQIKRLTPGLAKPIMDAEHLDQNKTGDIRPLVFMAKGWDHDLAPAMEAARTIINAPPAPPALAEKIGIAQKHAAEYLNALQATEAAWLNGSPYNATANWPVAVAEALYQGVNDFYMAADALHRSPGSLCAP